MQKDDQHCWKLKRVWDHFLVKGWKVIFKVCILILKVHEEVMLEMSFENMLANLSRLPDNYLILHP